MVDSLLQISLYIFFSKFKTNMFADVEKSIKFLLEIIPLVSSANSIGSVVEFICNGRSFI